jgi:hypothetical protein
MTKPQLNDCLFSLNLAHGYLKTYGLKDYEKEYVLMHLRSTIEIIEGDRIEKEESKPQLAYGVYNNIKDKDTPKNN